MHVFVNIVPQNQLDWACLSTLVGELTSQHFADASFNLQLPADQALTPEQQDQVVAWGLTVNQLQPTLTPHNYLINLRETDHVLPGALHQWAQVMAKHTGSPISLAAFDSSEDLDAQIMAYVADHQESGLQQTYRQVATASIDDPDERLLTLWSLQSYSVQTNLQNIRQMTQRIRPTGILLPTELLTPTLPLVSAAQAFAVLRQGTDIVRLHVPTIQRSMWAEATPIAWLDELTQVDTAKLDVMWQPAYTDYVQRQLNFLLTTASRKQLSKQAHTTLMTRIKQLITGPTHRWSRLGLLQLISPRLAHQLFY
ncbi:hypothetical protein [Levilactobacillus parabrevis]|uniref:hypothetical protein n=1 Tax=Levilactobacillus parabrevis TaxID=357278 RepID=UPI0021A5530F|nr:hypothetical protein [Levilactobacillus parabrevis]MCT4486910.1 hypothetical protein [Levilactobacillus parabrevis]MCT4489485.1 hypothetical protein [Levilactobacillus parabrevis]